MVVKLHRCLEVKKKEEDTMAAQAPMATGLSIGIDLGLIPQPLPIPFFSDAVFSHTKELE